MFDPALAFPGTQFSHSRNPGVSATLALKSAGPAHEMKLYPPVVAPDTERSYAWRKASEGKVDEATGPAKTKFAHPKSMQKMPC